MSEIVTVPCGIENCSQHLEYKLDNQDPTILSGQWRNKEPKNDDWDGLLTYKPLLEEEYELSIEGALKIDLSKNFWVSYFDPYSTLEGIESEEGIASMAFCLCRKIELIDLGVKKLKVKVRVLKILDLAYANEIPRSKTLVTDFLNKEVTSGYYSIHNFDNYSLIDINFQSDVGQTYIISKQEKKSRVVAENYWDFHQDTWQIRNEELTKEQEERYGIQH